MSYRYLGHLSSKDDIEKLKVNFKPASAEEDVIPNFEGTDFVMLTISTEFRIKMSKHL